MLDRRAFFSSFGFLGVIQPPTQYVITDTCTACKVGRYSTLGPLAIWTAGGGGQLVAGLSHTIVDQRCTTCGDRRAVPKTSTGDAK
jgi:hypothetical protein